MGKVLIGVYGIYRVQEVLWSSRQSLARNLRKAGRIKQADKMLAVVKNSLEQDRKNWSMFFVNKLQRDRNALWKVIKQSLVSSNSSGPLKRSNGTLTFNKKEKVKLLSDRYKSVHMPKTYPKCNIEDLTKTQWVSVGPKLNVKKLDKL